MSSMLPFLLKKAGIETTIIFTEESGFEPIISTISVVCAPESINDRIHYGTYYYPLPALLGEHRCLDTVPEDRCIELYNKAKAIACVRIENTSSVGPETISAPSQYFTSCVYAKQYVLRRVIFDATFYFTYDGKSKYPTKNNEMPQKLVVKISHRIVEPMLQDPAHFMITNFVRMMFFFFVGTITFSIGETSYRVRAKTNPPLITATLQALEARSDPALLNPRSYPIPDSDWIAIEHEYMNKQD